MSDQPQNIELYKVVEKASQLVAEIQQASNTNQDRMGYVTRRSDRRLANPMRLAKIWSEGQLQEVEDAFDKARDGQMTEKMKADIADASKRRRGKGRRRAGDPIHHYREQLFGLWNNIRGDSGFKNATKRVKSSISQAGKEARQLQKEGKKLDLMLNKTIAAVRDMKHAMAAGIRQVPYNAILDAGPNVSLEHRVSAVHDVSVKAMARAQPEAVPSAAPSPNMGGGGGGGSSDHWQE
ncbi:MAG: hypothetical protein CL558_03275 [Alphaproteobacteria bacterium]|nr:hypothetical protein [Alphaproteobacteria bacterium]MAS49029.1 hypothetical protein [Alphaproteobacteria bacterium]MAX97369.1 hypothetical protein [Alphaproteobacteria bacterium]MBN52583.1 hypothetical protein [Alphaproteobacteria bacterium]OUT39635.1 MAG: hypothetical protein CBB62_14845 [Micavibrio sp. TMED2]|tara:strand:- start:21824 stop:22534 length:711 start_codon:yes stop_codon:yes gene_type:complete